MDQKQKTTIKHIVFLSFLSIQLSGCWGITVPGSAPDKYPNTHNRNALIGSSVHEAIETLGYPDKVRERNGNKYLIYKDYGSGLDVGFFLYAPFFVFPADSQEGSIHCLLIEINEDYVIQDIQLETRGKGPSWVLPESCVRLFWKPDELSSFHDSTEDTVALLREQRKDRLEAGLASHDVSSAIRLVEEFGETTALEYLVEEADTDTLNQLVSSIITDTGLQIYFKIREHNPELANTILCNAIKQGYCEAYILMGAIHFTGNGVPTSKEKAYIWYRIAENNNCPDCCSTSIGYIQEWLSAEQINNAELLLDDWNPEQCEVELGCNK